MSLPYIVGRQNYRIITQAGGYIFEAEPSDLSVTDRRCCHVQHATHVASPTVSVGRKDELPVWEPMT